MDITDIKRYSLIDEDEKNGIYGHVFIITDLFEYRLYHWRYLMKNSWEKSFGNDGYAVI